MNVPIIISTPPRGGKGLGILPTFFPAGGWIKGVVNSGLFCLEYVIIFGIMPMGDQVRSLIPIQVPVDALSGAY
jgi:hypothetical protein